MIRRIVCLLLLFVATFGMPVTSQCASQVVILGAGPQPHNPQNFPNYASVTAPLTNVVAIRADGGHVIVLQSDGRILAWGANSEGQSTVPTELPSIGSIATGAHHNLVLDGEGKPHAWGEGYFGDLPNHWSNAVQVAARGYRNIYLANDTSLIGMGSYPSIPHLVSLRCGLGDFEIGLLADQTVITNGKSARHLNLPMAISNIVSVAGGLDHALALHADGRVIAFGRNDRGQTNVPASATNIVAIEGGAYFSVVLREDGRVIIWGDGDYSPAPTVPEGLSNVVAIAADWNAAYAVVWPDLEPEIMLHPRGASILSQTPFLLRVEAVGTPRLRYQWRKDGVDVPGATNDFFYLPLAQADDSGDYTVAVANHLGTNVSSVASLVVTDTPPFITQTPTNALHSTYGSPVTFSATATGSPPLFYQWQFNGEDIPDATNSTYTVASPTFASEGDYRVRARNAYGEEYAEASQLTLLPVVITSYAGSPFPKSLTNLVSIAAGQHHCVGLREDGTVVSWQINGAGGQNVVPSGISNIVSIAAGRYHSLALRRDGHVYAWGPDYHGVTNVPPEAVNVISIAAGFEHSYALRNDGYRIAWGRGEIFPTTWWNYWPGAIEVAAGWLSRSSFVIFVDGTVVGSGANDFNQLDDSNSALNVTAASSAFASAIGLKKDGTAQVWGQKTLGNLDFSPPANATNLTAVSAGSISEAFGSFFVGLKSDGSYVAWGQPTHVPMTVPGKLVLRAEVVGFNVLLLLGSEEQFQRVRYQEALEAGALEFSIPTTHRRDYLLQARDSLTDGDWTNVQTLPGNGQVRFFDPQTIGSGERYFRLELQETFRDEP